MKIEKKVWPEYFKEIVSGNKTYEIRLGDWRCEPGDILILKEWDPETKEYTGSAIEKKITYVRNTKDVKFWSKEEIEKYGLQIIAFK